MTRFRSARLVTAGLVVLLCALATGQAFAQAQAWLDRDRIAFGETTTLNIESDETSATPDWSPLEQDFTLSGHTSRRQVEIRNGRQTARTLHGVALRPRRDGLVVVPALQIGSATTAPLQLSVGPALVSAARDGAPAFVEAEIDTQSPYVQQAVAYTVRLYYAVPLVSGQLEQPPPDGASLQRVGSDTQFTRDIGGRRYTVVERRFLLVPARSGTLTIPGARFEGRGVSGGMFDGLFNRGPRELAANGPPSVLSVRPMPAGIAGRDWLPVHDVQARWLEAAPRARAGEAATLVLEVVFDGAVGTQLPDVVVPPVDGAQIFAEAPQYDETFEDGRPQVRLTRRVSVVPQAAGRLRIAGPQIAWWDVGAGQARTAATPVLTLDVEPAAVRAPTDRLGIAGTVDPERVRAAAPGDAATTPVWQWLALLFALLWLATATLAWRLYRRTPPAPAVARPDAPAATGARPSPRQLRVLLQTGEPAEIEQALRGLVVPPASDLDALHARLDAADQRDALVEWRHARWGGGDLGAARRRLITAFRHGARETPGTTADDEATLPPLYPRR